MTVNIRNNRILLIVSIVDVLLSTLYAVKRVYYFYINVNILYSLTIISEVTFLISLFYLSVLLKSNGERKFIISGFYLLIITSLLVSFEGVFNNSPTNYVSAISNIIGVLCLIYTIIVIFFIKNSTLSRLFRIYAYASILTFILDICPPIILPSIIDIRVSYSIMRYIGFVNLLPLLSMCYIFYNSDKVINAKLSV